MPEGGSVRATATGVVLTSGKPVRVWGYRMVSAATGPGTLTMYDGTSASGTLRLQAIGVSNGNTNTTFGAGIFFSTGLFITLDADVTSVDIDCQQTQST